MILDTVIVDEVDEAITALGLFAAICDVASCDRTITTRERNELELRASRYRDLQLAALSEINLATGGRK